MTSRRWRSGTIVIIATIVKNTCGLASFATIYPKNVADRQFERAFDVEHAAPWIENRMRRPRARTLQSAKDLTTLNMAKDVDEKDYVSPMRQRPCPEGGDIAYTQENILRQMRNYSAIRKVGGADCVLDIYVRDPNKFGKYFRYWFVGKVARCTGTVSSELAVARQLNLIEEHATRIRPVELGRYFGRLDFFVAPGDTELLTSQNDPGIRLQNVPRSVEGVKEVSLLEVGLNLEIVTNRGAGLSVIRTLDGVVPPDLIGN